MNTEFKVIANEIDKNFSYKLNDWEVNFLESIITKTNNDVELSDNQKNKLISLYEKVTDV